MATPKKKKTTWELRVEYTQKGLAPLAGGLGKLMGFLNKGASLVDAFNNRLFMAGVTTIFVDRLMQSFVRVWRTLNEVVGADRLGEAANSFSRISEFTGVAIDKLQAFTYGVRIAGAELDDVSDLFQTIAERVDDLRAGEGGVSGDFARYGFNKDSFAGVSDALDMWLIMAEKFDQMRPDERLAAMEKLLGGDIARKFGQTVKGGSQAIIDMMQAAQASGAVLGPQEIADARAYYEMQMRVRRALELVSNALGAMIMPQLSQIWEIGAEILERTAKFLRFYGGIKQWFARTVTPILDGIEAKLVEWDRYYMSIEETVFRLGRAFLVVFAGAGMKSFGLIIAAARGGLEVLKSLVVVVDDFITYLYDANPRNSVFASLVRTSPLVQAALLAAYSVFLSLKGALRDIWDTLQIITTGPIGPAIVEVLLMSAVFMAQFVKETTAAVKLIVQLVSVLMEIPGTIAAVPDLIAKMGLKGGLAAALGSLISAGNADLTLTNSGAVGPLGGAPPGVSNTTFNYFGSNMTPGLATARYSGRKANGAIR